MTTVAPPTSRLTDLAGQILTLAAQILDDAGYPPPQERYVAPGHVMALPGCESLGVVVQRVYAGQPGAETRTVPINCDQILSGQLQVVLNRCVPIISEQGLPGWVDLDAAGRSLTDQGAALIYGFQSALGRSPAGGQIVGVAGPLEQLLPQGGIGGWRITINARL